MNIDKIYVSNVIYKIALSYSELDAEAILVRLVMELRKAQKTHKNIKLVCYDGELDVYDHVQTYLSLQGDRLETDKEWHDRLLEEKRRIIRELEEARLVMATQNTLEGKVDAIDKALQK